MLRRLTIENIGVIDRLDIPFEDGFTVLTGETGAGKSIIINCISLVLGAKADGSLVRSGATRARIEAMFEPNEIYGVLPDGLLKKLGIKDGESASPLHIAREIDGTGRGNCTVNGRKVALKVLQEAGRYLAESHGQRQTLALLRPGEQREILDRYGELEEDASAWPTLSGSCGEFDLTSNDCGARRRRRRLDARNWSMSWPRSERLRLFPERTLCWIANGRGLRTLNNWSRWWVRLARF